MKKLGMLKSFVAICLTALVALPMSPTAFTAGGGNCTLDQNGTLNKCNGYGGNICQTGVKTCGSGTALSTCTDGTAGSNGGQYNCPGSNCSGTRYHPVTNATGCAAPVATPTTTAE